MSGDADSNRAAASTASTFGSLKPWLNDTIQQQNAHTHQLKLVIGITNFVLSSAYLRCRVR